MKMRNRSNHSKLESLLIALLAILLTICGFGLGIMYVNRNSKAEEPTTETETFENYEPISKEIPEAPKTPAEKLISEYRAGVWNGDKITMEDGNDYYVDEMGILNKLEYIAGSSEPIPAGLTMPDVPDSAKVAFGTSVRLSSASGVVAINTDYTEISHYSYGKLISSHKIDGKLAEVINGRVEVLAFGNRIAVKEGQHMIIYRPLDNWVEDVYDNVIDFCIEKGKLVFSTFEDTKNGTVYKNFIAANDSSQISLDNARHYIKLPRKFDEGNGISGYGQAFYVGTGRDSKYFYLKTNDNGYSYTLFYKDVESGVEKTVAKNVIDAEGDTLGCYYITTDQKLCYVSVDSNPKLSSFSGTVYALTPAIGEDDTPCFLTTKEEANLFSSNGWDYLYNPARR